MSKNRLVRILEFIAVTWLGLVLVYLAIFLKCPGAIEADLRNWPAKAAIWTGVFLSVGLTLDVLKHRLTRIRRRTSVVELLGIKPPKLRARTLIAKMLIFAALSWVGLLLVYSAIFLKCPTGMEMKLANWLTQAAIWTGVFLVIALALEALKTRFPNLTHKR